MTDVTCSEGDCGRPVRARGWCSKHYERFRHQKQFKPSPYLRFEKKLAEYVDRSGGPLACWPWTNTLTDQGYARTSQDGRQVYVHVAMYEIGVGPVPSGMELDHVCHSDDPRCPGGAGCAHRRCVNPAHLEAVPQRENTQRGVNGFTHKGLCRAGLHDMSNPANIYTSPDGEMRQCMPCRVASYTAWHAIHGKRKA